ncbi:leukocyte receptor cluster member 8 [Manduca sexta]|uniref:leukocyte receptor cluster member 8 n=1 Tax=Manduca sexta TaxID=7130 RepID=UPI0011832671|nr:leukocyte receptor cluster member 8 [Manduca sexta]
MSENNSKDPALQTMNGMLPNPNWMYGMYHGYNGYHGMYPPYFNQYYNQMGNNGGFPGNPQHFQHNKDTKPEFSPSQFSKPPPLLGPPPPLDTNRPFHNQGPIRFNLNSVRKPAPLPPIENPLLSTNCGPKKKRKKGNNKTNDDNQECLNIDLPPLPDHPPPLPPLPPPDIPKPPPPPIDIPLPPPLPLESLPEPPEFEEPVTQTSLEEDVHKNPPANIFKTNTMCPSSAGNWPDSLERYIKRCYEKCKSTFDRDQIDICLKGRITAAANKDEIWTRNWDEEPIPSVHSERNNLSVKPVRGALSLYQKCENIVETSKNRPSLAGRSFNTHKNSPQRRRRPHSRSRSRSRSPPRKRLSSSSTSSDEVEDKKIKQGKGRQKLKDRLSLDQKKCDKYPKNKKKQYNQFVVEDFQGNAEKLLKRAERFAGSGNVPSIASSLQAGPKRIEPTIRKPIIQDNEGDYEVNNMHIVGTCLDLEKSFLRLTKAPEACEVRPVCVLKASLKYVKEKWVERQDYRYACDQLKSIRQDLTVQGVRDSFTVDVYETHARIALEKGDHEEFNQCQTQLKMLYSELPDSRANSAEFTAYRILYYIFTKNTLDLTTIFQFLSKDDRENECIKHALETRCAWATGNLHKFFLLYKTAPLMAGYLMEWFIERERKQYLKYIIKSYRQTVPVDFIIRELAFESSSKAFEFLNQFPLSYTGCDQTQIDCKASLPAVASI